MSEFTYATLTSAVIDTMEERGSEFASFLSNVAFEIVNQRMANRLDSLGMVSVAYASLVTANPYIARPEGMRTLKSFNVMTSSGRREPLIFKTDEFLLSYWPERTSVGTPKYYANWGDTHILIAPADYLGREIELEYEVSPSVLSSTTPTNWYTKYAAAALYAGLMAEACKFTKNWAAADYWKKEFEEELALVLKNSERNRRDDSAPVPGPSTNNLGDKG